MFFFVKFATRPEPCGSGDRDLQEFIDNKKANEIYIKQVKDVYQKGEDTREPKVNYNNNN